MVQEVDTSAAKVRDKLPRAEPLTDNENEWARFLLWLGRRNPTETAKFKERVKRDFPSPTPKWRRSGAAFGRKECRSCRRLSSAQGWQNKKVLDTLVGMDWMVTDLQTANRSLLTCGRPFIMATILGLPNGHVGFRLS
ncbi:MAG: hypothetical protein ACK4ZU_19730 [Allorhizobium sp.]